MALSFHARPQIPQKSCPPSRVSPARYRAKAALLNSRMTPSNDLFRHVTLDSHVFWPARQKNSFNISFTQITAIAKFQVRASFFFSETSYDIFIIEWYLIYFRPVLFIYFYKCHKRILVHTLVIEKKKKKPLARAVLGHIGPRWWQYRGPPPRANISQYGPSKLG
mgnify:CR=1 FL=1